MLFIKREEKLVINGEDQVNFMPAMTKVHAVRQKRRLIDRQRRFTLPVGRNN